MQKSWPEQGASSLLCPRWGVTFDGRVLGTPSPEIPHALDVGHLLSVGPPSVLSCDSGSGAVSWVLLCQDTEPAWSPPCSERAQAPCEISSHGFQAISRSLHTPLHTPGERA